MLRRVSYYCLMIVALVSAAVVVAVYIRKNGLIFVPWTAGGYIDLGRLLVLIGAVVVAASLLRRDQGSSAPNSLPGSDIDLLKVGRTNVRFRRLSYLVGRAFGRNPIVATLLAIVFVALPVCLVGMTVSGGIKAFNTIDWIVVGLAELPIVTLAVLRFCVKLET